MGEGGEAYTKVKFSQYQKAKSLIQLPRNSYVSKGQLKLKVKKRKLVEKVVTNSDGFLVGKNQN